jgi:hypothetical protein
MISRPNNRFESGVKSLENYRPSFWVIRKEAYQSLFVVIITWLGRWFLIKTFDNGTDCDVEEIRQILDEENQVPEQC